MQDGGTHSTFLYDGLGRQRAAYPTGAADRVVTYSQYDLPRTVENAAGVTTFMFDAAGARARKIGPDGTTATVYVEGVYERRVGAEGDTRVYYVSSPDDGLVAQFHDDRAAPKAAMLYHVTDPLQSVSLVLDEAGATVERTSYDPFGARVDVNGEPAADGDPRVTLGFTGHEHDDDLGLVNMRGRIYDPAQRRFLTPDPLISHPLFGQSYNPYSYVLNNPVNLTDPSGYQSTTADQQQRRADANNTRLDAKDAAFGTKVDLPDDPLDYCASGADNIGRCGLIGPPAAADTALPTDGAGGTARPSPPPAARPTSPAPSPERRLLSGFLHGMGIPSSRAEAREVLGNAAQGALQNPGAIIYDPTTPFRMAYGLAKTLVEAPIHLGGAAAAASNGDMNAVADEAGAAVAGFVQLGMTALSVKAAGPPAIETSGSAPVHHIMTNKNVLSIARGGPWTPRFADMAKRAGMTLEDAANKVAVEGHRGPHSQAYHQAVFDQLSSATDGLSGNAYSAAFRRELSALRTAAATPGSTLNRLLTGQ